MLTLLNDLEDVIHIPLDSFSYDTAYNLQQSMGKWLKAAGVRMRGTRLRPIRHKDGEFGIILSKLWSCVVKPILDCLAFLVRPSFSLLSNLTTQFYPRYQTSTTSPMFGGVQQDRLPFSPFMLQAFMVQAIRGPKYQISLFHHTRLL